jgi:ribosomal-protein-alanine N-acetyltransferase
MNTINKLQLKSERLLLSPVTLADLLDLHTLFTDQQVRKFLFDDQEIPLAQTDEILHRVLDTFREKGYGLWFCRKKLTDERGGIVGLFDFFSEDQPQLLYALPPPWQGQGFATEASQRIIQYAFEELGYAYLTASCDVPNVKSIAVMERLGMHPFEEKPIEGKSLVFYRLDRT